MADREQYADDLNRYAAHGQTELYRKLDALRPEFAKAAQKVYDEWDADGDPEYGDPELGFGGICQDIAAAVGDVCSDHGIDSREMNAQVGEQHVWQAAHDDKHAYHVDISPHHYETGGGYHWKKIPGVTFTPEHIDIEPADHADITSDDY